MDRDGSVRIKLALEGPSWHGHLGGSHAILTISMVGIRFLRADITKLALDRSSWHGHLGCGVSALMSAFASFAKHHWARFGWFYFVVVGGGRQAGFGRLV